MTLARVANVCKYSEIAIFSPKQKYRSLRNKTEHFMNLDFIAQKRCKHRPAYNVGHEHITIAIKEIWRNCMYQNRKKFMKIYRRTVNGHIAIMCPKTLHFSFFTLHSSTLILHTPFFTLQPSTFSLTVEDGVWHIRNPTCFYGYQMIRCWANKS